MDTYWYDLSLLKVKLYNIGVYIFIYYELLKFLNFD